MKKLFLAFPLLVLTACTPTPTPVELGSNSSTVSNFEECMAAGNPVMESFPRQCRHEDRLFVEEVATLPPTENASEKPCTKEFMPVCGEIQVQCITTPCNPIKTTFGNKCEAENAGAMNLVEGACEDETINPEGACLSFDGKWLEESQECEGMAQEQCETLGGQFNECASACRNDLDAEICTMQCVVVCQF